MNRYSKIIPVCLMVSLTACSEFKKLDSMRESTTEMRDTTKELLQVSKEMNKTTKNLATTSDDMRDRMTKMQVKTEEMKGLTEGLSKQSAEIYDASRQGASMTARREILDSVYKAESGGQKAVFAALYFKGFEFQFWTGADKDKSVEKRHHLMTDAVKEFFKAISEFDNDVTAPDPIAKHNPSSELHGRSNKEASFNAIALTLHEWNSKQDDTLEEHKGLERITMLKLIVDSLAAEKAAIDQGKSMRDLPEYQKAVLENKDVAMKLLQARHNVLLALFLKEPLKKHLASTQVAPKNPSFVESVGHLFNNFVEKAKVAANIYANLDEALPWNLNLDQYNLQQTEMFSRYLSACLQTRAALSEKIGVAPVLHGHLENLLRGLQIAGGGQGASELLEAQAKLRDVVAKMKATALSPVVAPVSQPAAPPSAQPTSEPAPTTPASPETNGSTPH